MDSHICLNSVVEFPEEWWDDHTIVPLSHRIILKIVRFQVCSTETMLLLGIIPIDYLLIKSTLENCVRSSVCEGNIGCLKFRIMALFSILSFYKKIGTKFEHSCNLSSQFPQLRITSTYPN